MILKFLNWQGIAGIGIALALSILLLVQKGETRHWKKQSAGFEQLYHSEQAAFATTVANYRAAAEKARADDQANVQRVTVEQAAINERTTHDFEARLAAARAAERLRRSGGPAATNSSAGRNAPMPGVPAPARGPVEAASQGGLPAEDALTATEQAIQLDELIKWVRSQAGVNPNAGR